MVNAWSLAYDVINGTMDENFPVKKKEEPDDTVVISTGSTDSATFVNFDLNDPNFNVGIDTSNYELNIDTSGIESIDLSSIELPDGMSINQDYIAGEDVYGDTWPHAETLNIDTSDYPSAFTTLSDNDDAIAHHVTTPTPGIQKDCTRKYKEDESIKALQDYISTTYGGHYTSDNNNVQTLDLIESVGDAESFCRSNAIKYLSRYDKKGQAKRDILKALHYSLLLYHFSGQLNETTTRGYETF
jgi:hypothetical protein